MSRISYRSKRINKHVDTTNPVILLLIDTQIDFCSPQNPRGSLYVPEAELDCARTQKMIINNIDEIGEIYCTLDTHHCNHIAHAVFWYSKEDTSDKSGFRPESFAVIRHEDIGVLWFAADPSLRVSHHTF